MVHTDVKLDSVFANYGQSDQCFSDIQLGDCGGVVFKDSGFAREGHLIGAALTCIPEAMFQLSWRTSTNVWSFENAILSLMHGEGRHHFDPGWEGIKPEDQDYETTVVKRILSVRSYHRLPTSLSRTPSRSSTSLLGKDLRKGHFNGERRYNFLLPKTSS
ncbi:uncharacterized protein BCR38DRAFT_7642 [Pseudomassariella vexata]|uniref:Protein kinase domain-containing protein n=1 Tax=Pseudomassariella vexata TaxID=1141098 RepID=A0A1Y2EI91_9PEZI|nr:uncharacterized protein BCR38DRAFT_7642 [Pseudomassariella vexata]ORY71298.1 hypothetical protein BCR38DRAFT_7642 [Pseudomassariella vexata]